MLNLSSLLTRHARFRPDATAVVCGDQRLDYRNFNARVNRLAHVKRELRDPYWAGRASRL